MAKGVSAQDTRVKELMAKGYTKSKVTQALKDAGNNYQLALRILEAQPSQASATARPTSSQGARPVAQCGPVAARPAAASSPAVNHDAVRRHPCVVQYKTCKYGQHCRLKDYPGDTCIQYFHGFCVFGDSCKRRHFIDGVDIREGLRPEMDDAVVSKDGTFRVLSRVDGKVQIAERLPEDGGVGDDPSAGLFVYIPQQADFNRVRGAEPTHTDPYAAPLHVGASTAAAAPRPTPFLDSLKRGLDERPEASSPYQRPPVAAVAQATATSRGADSCAQSASSSGKKHPCVAQFGFCKYGDSCHHADRDADVCVHFLHGRCKFTSDTCLLRHETYEAYVQTLMARTGAADGQTEGTNGGTRLAVVDEEVVHNDEYDENEDHADTTFVPKAKLRLQSFGTDHAPATSSPTARRVDVGSYGGFPPAHIEDEARYASASSAMTAQRARNPYLLKDADRKPFTGDEFLPPELRSADEDEDDDYGYEEDEEDVATEGRLGNPQDDRELEALLKLMEVFPHADPLVVMQALRSCSGDSDAAAELLTRVTSVESRETGVDEVLAQAMAEEEVEVAQQAEREAAARCEALLTLSVLFPSVEPAEIEAVLQRCQNDFHDAYGVLLCAQENVSRRAYGHFWNGRVNPAESLKLSRLEGMFPEIHPDIVRSTFGTCECSVPKTIDALNQLTTELLALETRTSLGEEATRWRPHAVLARPHSGFTQPDVACPVETSEELSEAYTEAQRMCRELGDWRRVRQRAYLVNTARIRMLALACAAFANGEGRVAKLLSREGKDLGREYTRLNRLAMLALERERVTTQPTSTLDVHDFHVEEAVEVLCRRVDLCRKKRIHHLTVIVGAGKHSRREGHSSIYPVLTQKIREDPYFKHNVRLTSIKPTFLELTIKPAD